MVEKVQSLSGETSDTFDANNVVIKPLKEGSVDLSAIISMKSSTNTGVVSNGLTQAFNSGSQTIKGFLIIGLPRTSD